MIKKIIHLGDIHLRTYKRHDEYGEIFKKTVKEIRKITMHIIVKFQPEEENNG